LAPADKQDEERIYEVTKGSGAKAARNLLDNGHGKGKVISLESAVDGVEGIGGPLHPGAERFYKEVGLLK